MIAKIDPSRVARRAKFLSEQFNIDTQSRFKDMMKPLIIDGMVSAKPIHTIQ
jgi:hypothetical protein